MTTTATATTPATAALSGLAGAVLANPALADLRDGLDRDAAVVRAPEALRRRRALARARDPADLPLDRWRREEAAQRAMGLLPVAERLATWVVDNTGSVDDLAAQVLARDIAKQFEEELTYPGQIKVTVIRESRATEVAR